MSPRARGTGSVYQRRNRDGSTATTWTYQAWDRRSAKVVKKGGFPTEAAAARALRDVLSRQDRGLPIGPKVDATTFEDLIRYVEDDHKANRLTGTGLAGAVKHLRQHFAQDRAVDVDESRITAYTAARLEEGAAPATVNRELAILRRGFTLGVRSLHVARRPYIAMLREDNVRKGFFEWDQFQAVLAHLEPSLQRLAKVAYVTGWRVPSELQTRQWRHVDMHAGWLRLEPGEDKNRSGRMFPLDYPFGSGTLKDVFLELAAERDRLEARGNIVPWVFHRDGRQIKEWTRPWEAAVKKAGLPGKLRHDFRRTAARNMERAGISRSIAMRLIGHKTESMYRRYAVVTEQDLRDASRKVAKGR